MSCGAAASAEHLLMLHGASPTGNHGEAARWLVCGERGASRIPDSALCATLANEKGSCGWHVRRCSKRR
ncbi:hypothetical protein XAPC_2361 [Xanthomonas citri pv. punicae str. LMG 859]|nr:hypothetical protein XAPC_2361 [Xanthomonas citri pv. punicae str. LMG 859]